MTTMLAALAIVAAETRSVEFRYVADQDLKQVTVAGTFNGWNKGANPLKRGSDGRTWTLTKNLPVGKHYYKFVLNDETWITDPAAKKNEDDGNGNINSVLLLVPNDYSAPAVRGDRRITRSGLKHEQMAPDFNYDRGRLRLTVRTRAGDVGSVTLLANGKRHAMTRISGDDFYETYATSFPWNLSGTLRYGFQFEKGANALFYGPKGVTPALSSNTFEIDQKTFQPFEVPSWVERTIIYQIFPDRFDNAKKANDPAETVPWDAKPENGDMVFGGDIAGIDRRLDHFKKLNVGTIYLNPIFQSPVVHRYETTDYKLIDRRLGTNDEFIALSKRFKKEGIGLVLDGVFNHVAPDFPQFVDILKNQEKSKYTKWFYINRYPVAVVDPPPYEAWWGFKSMPKVNLLNRDAADYMLEIPKWWAQRAEIAGWRLDVANEVPMEFWREFREVVKGINDDKWIVGEVWTDGSQWLKGDQWDSVMNYPFRDAVLKFVAEGRTTPTQFAERLMANYSGYAPQVSRNMMNLLGSHDTPRFMTLCGNNEDLAMLGASVMFAWIGAPMIYYGDELGMQGERDPDNRRGMLWNTANKDNRVFQHYLKLTKARSASRALQSGDPRILFTNDREGTLGFERVLGNERAFVLINRSNEKRAVSHKVSVRPGQRTERYVCAITGQAVTLRNDGTLSMTLAPVSASILLRAR